jgi:hypothetical protein
MCTLLKQFPENHLEILRVKYVNKCELLRNAIRFFHLW